MSNHTMPIFKMQLALSIAREIEPSMHIQVLMGLLHIAMHPGCSTGDLMEALSTTSASAARITGRLSTWERPAAPGLGLVNIETDTNDRRLRIITLTPKGRRMVERLEEVLV